MGESLSRYIKEISIKAPESLSERNILELLEQIISALLPLHLRNTPHGNISSENIIRTKTGCIQLSNFSLGSAEIVHECLSPTAKDPGLPVPNIGMMTHREASKVRDISGIGGVLYEMLYLQGRSGLIQGDTVVYDHHVIQEMDLEFDMKELAFLFFATPSPTLQHIASVVEEMIQVRETGKTPYATITPAFPDPEVWSEESKVGIKEKIPVANYITGSYDKHLVLWDSNLKIVDKYKSRKEIKAVYLLHDNRIIITDGEILKIEKNKLVIAEKLSGKVDIDYRGVCEMPTTWEIVTTHYNVIKIWTPKSLICRKVLEGHTHMVTVVKAYSTSELLSGSLDHTIRIWNTVSGESLREILYNRPVIDLYIFTNDTIMVITSNQESGSIQSFNYRTRKSILSTQEYIYAFRSSDIIDSNRIIIGTSNGKCIIFNYISGVYEGCFNIGCGAVTVNQINVARDENQILISMDKSYFAILDFITQKLKIIKGGHTKAIKAFIPIY